MDQYALPKAFCLLGACAAALLLGAVMGILLFEACSVTLQGAASFRCRCCMVRKRKIEVVEVLDSPSPTRMASSPFPTTRRRGQNGLSITPATRAGCRRIRSPHGGKRLVFNPRKQGHCGYECILALAKVARSSKAIKALRHCTAKIVQKEAEKGGVMAGFRRSMT